MVKIYYGEIQHKNNVPKPKQRASKIQVPGKTMFLHKNKHVSQDILVNTFKHWKIDKHNLFFWVQRIMENLEMIP